MSWFAALPFKGGHFRDSQGSGIQRGRKCSGHKSAKAYREEFGTRPLRVRTLVVAKRG